MDHVPPSDDELRQVEELRSMLEAEQVDFKFTNTAVLRFLRGRKGDVDKAFRALKRHVEWRKEHDVDNISADTIREEIDSGKVTVNGVDLKGRPVITVIARKHDKSKRDFDQMRRFIIYMLEETMKQAQPHEEKMVILFDLAGFGMQCMDYEILKMLIEILQFNYPETLSVALVVSAPMLFSACWMIIRPWLDPVTAAKCTFLSTSQLTNHVDPAAIHPEVLGK
jgi:hypothetical protein